MNPGPEGRARAAGAFLHPIPWLAVFLLLLNDHVLKRAMPSPLTGKLSDFAGLAFFPLLLEALAELALDAAARYRGPSRRRLLGFVVLTGVAFAWMKTTASGGFAYARGLGLIRWPATALVALVSGEPLPPVVDAGIVRDPTDLVALLALLVAWAVGRGRSTNP